MKRKKILSLLVVSVLILALLSGCGGGSGGGGGGSSSGGGEQDVITMRLSSHTPIDHFIHELNLETVKLVEERTEGRVKLNYYPVSQLGDYSTVYEELMMGTVDFMQAPIPDTVSRILGAAYLPYYALGYDDLVPLYGKDSYMHGLMAEATEATGVMFLGFTVEGFIGMGCVKEPNDIFNPHSNKGVKMRAPGALLSMLYAIQDLNYDAVTIPYAEVPTSIQTGVVDGWSGGTPNVNYAWLSDVIKTMYVNYLHVESPAYTASMKSLAKLPDKDRQIVIDVFLEQSEKSFTMAKDNEFYYMGLLEAAGVDVVVYTPEQLKVNADFIRSVTWPRLAEEYTQEVIDKFLAETAKLH